MIHEQVHCRHEAANHQLPIAAAFWIIWVVPEEECSSLTQNLMRIHCSTNSVILNVLATQYTCSLNNIHCPPLTSTVKLPLFTHAHSSPLCLAPGGNHVAQSCYINNGCFFPDSPHTHTHTRTWELKTSNSENLLLPRRRVGRGIQWEGCTEGFNYICNALRVCNLAGCWIGGCLSYYCLHSLYVVHNIFNTPVFLSFGVQNIWLLCFTNGESQLILGHLTKGETQTWRESFAIWSSQQTASQSSCTRVGTPKRS